MGRGYFGVFVAIVGMAMVASYGCNQSNRSIVENSDANLANAESDADGCCEEKTASVSAECCGKCEQETATKVAKKSCCGKCEEETTALTKTASGKDKSGVGTSCEYCEGEACEECQKATANAASLKTAARPRNSAGEKGENDPGEQGTVHSMRDDRDVFHLLLRNHNKISRKVTVLKDGVKTVTESDDPELVKKIQEHVLSMKKRVEQRRPLRMWDELFREIFKHTDKIEMKVKKTDKGVEVTETSKDAYVAKLIQEHAKVVTGFTKRGFDEAHENHKVPKK